MFRNPAMRLLLRLALALIVAAAVLALVAWLALRESLPRLDGRVVLAGLAAEARVERDALGTVTISASNRADAMRALGFVHAQERYFEMDRMRRYAAGELAELFGARALDLDRAQRRHRLRARAAAALAAEPDAAREQLSAYTAGVNAGLAALSARPFPYLLTGTTPRPWSDEDALLVGYAMFFDLHDEANTRELAIGAMRDALPRAYVDWLFDTATEWDAPLFGEVRDPAPIPGPDVIDLRRLADPAPPARRVGQAEGASHRPFRPTPPDDDRTPGSNNFAVGGALTAHGGAIVENDMHLGLAVPNLWFRARLRYRTEDGRAIDVTGVTLPGVPATIVGSNGEVAWGYTNSYGDWLDWAIVRYTDPDRTRHAIDGGEAQIAVHRETILVKDAPPVEHLVRETAWGPIVHERDDGTALALAWTAHRPGAQNFAIAAFERARSARELVDLAKIAGMPPQNVVAGDRAGSIGWTVSGYVPRRAGIDALAPSDWSATGAGWVGAVASDRPELVDPPEHRLWSANSRVVDQAGLGSIGDGGYALGVRAKRIRELLRARDRFDERAMLAIALDVRVEPMARWQALLARTLAEADDASLATLRAAIDGFEPDATPDSPAYDDVRAFRSAVIERIRTVLAAPMRAGDPAFVLPGLQHAERLAWQLVSERPAHLLTPDYAGWDELLVDAAHEVARDAGGALATRRWGDVNSARIRHALASSIPLLGALLDAPGDALPGDTLAVRAQAPSFGASERMVVAPGREAHGYFHMPGGQSGHPLSPHYRAGHDAWVRGEPTPFLPGPAAHTLHFVPP